LKIKFNAFALPYRVSSVDLGTKAGTMLCHPNKVFWTFAKDIRSTFKRLKTPNLTLSLESQN
jgi:hypothetical protein